MAAAACESKGSKLLQQTVKYAACWSEGDGGERERMCNEIDMPQASSNQGMKRRGLWLLVLKCWSFVNSLSWQLMSAVSGK